MKGSITVESVFLVSMLLCILFWVLKLSIDLYQSTTREILLLSIDITDPAGVFRDMEILSVKKGSE